MFVVASKSARIASTWASVARFARAPSADGLAKTVAPRERRRTMGVATRENNILKEVEEYRVKLVNAR